MKRIFVILLTFLATPCWAQWIRDPGNNEVIAFGVHDTSLFYSQGPTGGFSPSIFRINPDGEADKGIGWGYGNITNFASLGRFFFANEGNVQAGYETSDNGFHWDYTTGAANSVASNGYYLLGTNSPPFTTEPPYVVRSTDSGMHWDSVSNFNNGNWGVYYAANGACIYATSPVPTVTALWRSLDTGARGSWIKLSPQPPFLGTMVTMGSLLFMYQSFVSGDNNANNGMLIRSRDSGLHWDTVQVDSAGVPEFVTCVFADSSDLFVGGYNSHNNRVQPNGNGLYVSTDTGKTWRAMNDGLGFLTIEALCYYPYDTTLNASTRYTDALGQTSYATYHRPLRELIDTTKSEVQVLIAARDSILVYPNPTLEQVWIFAGGTSILGIRVLNVLGTEILNLPRERAPAMSIDLSHLPSGTYFLEIQTPKGTVLRKVVRE